MKVFLGGTCNGSSWRDEIIPYLKSAKIDYFNPVVPDWTEECMVQEIEARKKCDFVLYVITPKMTGVYSIAEVVDDSNKRPCNTIFAILKSDSGKTFLDFQIKSLSSVVKMVISNGAYYTDNLKDIVTYINNKKDK